MTERIYPQRGDYVHVVEGGSIWIKKNIGWQIQYFIKGDVKIVLGCQEEWEDPEHSIRPGVWVNSSAGKGIVGPASWVPQYGPPAKQILDELNEK